LFVNGIVGEVFIFELVPLRRRKFTEKITDERLLAGLIPHTYLLQSEWLLDENVS